MEELARESLCDSEWHESAVSEHADQGRHPKGEREGQTDQSSDLRNSSFREVTKLPFLFERNGPEKHSGIIAPTITPREKDCGIELDRVDDVTDSWNTVVRSDVLETSNIDCLNVKGRIQHVDCPPQVLFRDLDDTRKASFGDVRIPSGISRWGISPLVHHRAQNRHYRKFVRVSLRQCHVNSFSSSAADGQQTNRLLCVKQVVTPGGPTAKVGTTTTAIVRGIASSLRKVTRYDDERLNAGQMRWNKTGQQSHFRIAANSRPAQLLRRRALKNLTAGRFVEPAADFGETGRPPHVRDFVIRRLYLPRRRRRDQRVRTEPADPADESEKLVIVHECFYFFAHEFVRIQITFDQEHMNDPTYVRALCYSCAAGSARLPAGQGLRKSFGRLRMTALSRYLGRSQVNRRSNHAPKEVEVKRPLDRVTGRLWTMNCHLEMSENALTQGWTPCLFVRECSASRSGVGRRSYDGGRCRSRFSRTVVAPHPHRVIFIVVIRYRCSSASMWPGGILRYSVSCSDDGVPVCLAGNRGMTVDVYDCEKIELTSNVWRYGNVVESFDQPPSGDGCPRKTVNWFIVIGAGRRTEQMYRVVGRADSVRQENIFRIRGPFVGGFANVKDFVEHSLFVVNETYFRRLEFLVSCSCIRFKGASSHGPDDGTKCVVSHPLNRWHRMRKKNVRVWKRRSKAYVYVFSVRRTWFRPYCGLRHDDALYSILRGRRALKTVERTWKRRRKCKQERPACRTSVGT